MIVGHSWDGQAMEAQVQAKPWKEAMCSRIRVRSALGGECFVKTQVARYAGWPVGLPTRAPQDGRQLPSPVQISGSSCQSSHESALLHLQKSKFYAKNFWVLCVMVMLTYSLRMSHVATEQKRPAVAQQSLFPLEAAKMELSEWWSFFEDAVRIFWEDSPFHRHLVDQSPLGKSWVRMEFICYCDISTVWWYPFRRETQQVPLVWSFKLAIS